MGAASKKQSLSILKDGGSVTAAIIAVSQIMSK